MVELIITEKPQAARKIADALSDSKPVKENNKGVPYYRITHAKKEIIVACAVGHLYGLDQKEGLKKWVYPIFDIEWKPSYQTKKSSAFTGKYLSTIKRLCKEVKEYTVATDYDIEGEVIGLNVVRYACRQKDAARMKFSTLTKDDLVKAYERKNKTLDWGQANAGEARHYLDWYNGINYSRALTLAIKSIGKFKIMSMGRVQGPALRTIVKREKEIRDFKPVPFWQVQLLGNVKKGSIEAWHIKDKFWDRKEADKVIKNTKGKKQGEVSKVEKSQYRQQPPYPFDLTTLQTETYRCHKISPKVTLQLAQELYTSGYISYPRTSSQQYPESIGYKKILSSLSKNSEYAELAKKILSKGRITPNNGKKTDPAHPAVYPTGIRPKSMDEKERKVYDIITKRFMATFAEPALRETDKVEIGVNSEIFLAKGTRTVQKGWHVFYQPYVKIEEEEIPAVLKGDKVKIKKIELQSKETQPPKRYTPSSIIRALEKRNLGTKATRAQIVDTLFQRGYIKGKAIEATELGIRTIETLEKYSPKIIDEELTKHFEEKMEEIRQGRKKEKDVLKEAKEALKKILSDFKAKEKEIGKELHAADIETRDAMITVGNCPVCKEGSLQMRKGKFGQFIACNRYPKCKTTFSLPNNALVKPTEKECGVCGYPLIQSIKKGKKPLELCINPKCKSKYVDGAAGREAKAVAKGKIEKTCPKCKNGRLTLRKSIYGSFYGCSNYPKCRYTEQLNKKENNQK
ncbi:DNA topoisomerase I [Candidatus Woesearchaeota archaeon]|nr:DNA topoisomerase I [Candidatus Woesearchaeota archaeon]